MDLWLDFGSKQNYLAASAPPRFRPLQMLILADVLDPSILNRSTAKRKRSGFSVTLWFIRSSRAQRNRVTKDISRPPGSLMPRRRDKQWRCFLLTYLLSFQAAQAVQPPQMDLEVPGKKRHNDGASEHHYTCW